MSRFNPTRDVVPVLSAAEDWIRRCLIEQGSIFSDQSLWTSTHLQQVVVAFTDNPDASDDSFIEKLEKQMSPAPAKAIRLMAELMWVLMLFQSNIRPKKKRETIGQIWGWAGTQLDLANPLLGDSVLQGIGSPGTAYNTMRWRELNYVIGLAADLAGRSREERESILRNRNLFEQWIADAPQEGYRQFKHLFRYLAFPDQNERITLGRDRRMILSAYTDLDNAAIKAMSDAEQDDALHSLRERLKQEYGRDELDYYEEPFKTRWKEGSGRTVAKTPEVASDFEMGFAALRERFLKRFPDFETFSNEQGYREQERNYKEELQELFHETVMAPLRKQDWPAAGEAFLALLIRPLEHGSNKPQNIVGWRYVDRIRQIGPTGRAKFAHAMVGLLDESHPIGPRVDTFLDRWREVDGEPRVLPAVQRSIVGFCLGLAHPQRHIFMKTNEMRRALRELDPSFNWSSGSLTGADVEKVDALAERVFSRLEAEGWEPEDFMDVQGFLWVAVNRSGSSVADGDDAIDDEGEPEAMPKQPVSRATPPLNQILFGPPGTGKTFDTINKALEILDPDFLGGGKTDRTRLKGRFDALVRDGLIRFVTFHQSFSYEDFVEGLRADSDETGALQYRVESGVFKQICDDARGAAKAASEVGIREGARIWKISIDGTGASPTREYGFKHSEARIGWGEVGDLDDERLAELPDYQALGSNDRNTLNAFSREIQPGDILLCIASASEVQAIGVVQGDYRFEKPVPSGVRSDYNNVLPVRWLATGLKLNLRELNGGVRFTLKTVYELTRFSWAELAEIIEAKDIRLQGRSTNSVLKPQEHVLIIDEINRGNMSRIFGELITLIEDSKRAGMAEQLEVILPYSKKRFQVPQSVYLIGTMNTADRSLAGLGIALRRRFSFVEMPPRPVLLKGIFIEGVNVQAMLETMNQRIEVLLDRDHTLGHAYFMSLQNGDGLDKLSTIFRSQILPLLQEYFFEDWQRIAWVLNDHRKAVGYRFVVPPPYTVESLFGYEAEAPSDAKLWRLDSEAFDRIESYAGIIEALPA